VPEQALYLKWRPQTFDEVVGQEHITRTLRNSVKNGRVRHAYLFSGPRGTGKTSTARLLAQAINCERSDAQMLPCGECRNCLAFQNDSFLDIYEFDAASKATLGHVEDLREKIYFAPGHGRKKVFIIDEVHGFARSRASFEAFLKTLEEPPSHAIFILATTEIDIVPATIKSRCQHFNFRFVPVDLIVNRLEQVAKSEDINVDSGVLELIARQATGSVRDSISLLDQLVTDPDQTLTLKVARDMLGTTNQELVADLVAALVAEDVAGGLHIISQAIDRGSDPRQFGQQIVDFLRNVMLAQTASADLIEASQDERELYTEMAERFERARLLKSVRAFNEAVAGYKVGWQPQLSLELALIEVMQAAEIAPVPSTEQPPAVSRRPRPRSQQASAPEAAADPPRGAEGYERVAASGPGEAPVYPVAKIQAGWIEILTQVHRYNRNIPPLLEHAHVRLIEGNRLILGVLTELFQQKIADPKRSKVIEQAIFDLHEVKLRLEVRVVDGVMALSDNDEAESSAPDDPLIAAGKALGGIVEE